MSVCGCKASLRASDSDAVDVPARVYDGERPQPLVDGEVLRENDLVLRPNKYEPSD
jgi:hypothetical protein